MLFNVESVCINIFQLSCLQLICKIEFNLRYDHFCIENIPLKNYCSNSGNT